MPDLVTIRSSALIVVLTCGAAWSQLPNPSPKVDLSDVISRMSQVQYDVITDQRAYEQTRSYQIFSNKDSNQDGIPDEQRPQTELLARIDFALGGQTSYRIERSTGGMGERVIRHALDHEVQLTKSPEQMEMTSRNYDFSFIGMADLRGRHCYVLESHPKGSDRNLLNAKVWVDAEDYHVLKIHGHPQKSPSFWIKDLDLTLEYSEMAGMWMHTSTKAHADVRFSGPFTLTAHAVSVQPSPMTVAMERARKSRVRAFEAGALVPLSPSSH